MSRPTRPATSYTELGCIGHADEQQCARSRTASDRPFRSRTWPKKSGCWTTTHAVMLVDQFEHTLLAQPSG